MSVFTSSLAALAAILSFVSGLPAPLPAGAEDDFVVITAAEEPREGRVLFSNLPLDHTSSDVASFRLPLAAGAQNDDDVVVIEAADYDEGTGRFISNIPRDRSFGIAAGPRLPLPDDDIVVIEAADSDDRSGRFISDIPRDRNFGVAASPRLPLPDDDFVVVEAAVGENEGRSLSDIPRDRSGPEQAGFRLPLPSGRESRNRPLTEDDLADIIEVGDYDDYSEESGRSITPHNVAGLSQASLRLPVQAEDDDFVVVGQDDPPVSSRTASDCLKPLTRSRCRASLLRYYYNTETQSCQEFSFGGCDSDDHSNRFDSLEECQQVCVFS